LEWLVPLFDSHPGVGELRITGNFFNDVQRQQLPMVARFKGFVERTLRDDELLPGADHVVLAAPATARTRHLLDAAAFAQMKPGAHLVNIARGSLVDQDALRAALDDGTVARATLDTVDPEPLPAGHWLYAHPQVRMTAHVSWYTPQLQAAAVDILIENIGRYLRAEPLLHVVDPAEGY